jgi:RHS repeat-associated protein
MQNSSSFFQGQPRFSNGFFGIYHSPFGVELKGRNLKKNNAKNYRFGFQGQEGDDQIKGDGNAVNYKYRMHDPRLGRFFAVDPLSATFPWNSTYAFSENRVIDAIEFEGLETFKISDMDNAKVLLLIDVTTSFKVIDEAGQQLTHFKYCEFEKIMSGWKYEQSGSVFSNNPNQKTLKTPNHYDPQMKQRTDLAGKALANWNVRIEKASKGVLRDLEYGIAGDPNVTVEDITNDFFSFIGTIPWKDGELVHFDVMKVYLPTDEHRAEFKKQFIANDMESYLNYNADDIIFLDKPESSDVPVGTDISREVKNSSQTLQVTYAKNECTE